MIWEAGRNARSQTTGYVKADLPSAPARQPYNQAYRRYLITTFVASRLIASIIGEVVCPASTRLSR